MTHVTSKFEICLTIIIELLWKSTDFMTYLIQNFCSIQFRKYPLNEQFLKTKYNSRIEYTPFNQLNVQASSQKKCVRSLPGWPTDLNPNSLSRKEVPTHREWEGGQGEINSKRLNFRRCKNPKLSFWKIHFAHPPKEIIFHAISSEKKLQWQRPTWEPSHA